MSSSTDFDSAKAYLMQAAGPDGFSAYDHLSELLARLIAEKPENAPDLLENMSYEIKADRFKAETTVQEQPEQPDAVILAKSQEQMLRHNTEVPEEEDEAEQVVPDLMKIADYFEGADIGLGREETFRIFLALKKLSEEHPLRKVSFWGKILGMEANYIVAEGEYRDGEEPQPEEDEGAEEQLGGDGEENDDEDQDPRDKLPESKFKPPMTLPTEDYGSGVNKKVYFVCNEPGEAWVLLPAASPACISVARQIRKVLTGRLDASVNAYPPFPGKEADLLRAQIARITAGTHVSPLNFFTFDEDEDDDDEEARDNFIESEDFEGVSLQTLLEPDLTGWMHHAPYILPQGRCKWVNPNAKDEDEEEDDEEEEDEDDLEIEAETGPPLLTPLQNDDDVDGQPAWSPRLTNTTHPSFAAVCISSNRWPGAHAFAVAKTFANVYIGWGFKYSSEQYGPPLPPAVQTEYAGADIQEATDPTRQEEEEHEAQQAEEEEEDDEGED